MTDHHASAAALSGRSLCLAVACGITCVAASRPRSGDTFSVVTPDAHHAARRQHHPRHRRELGRGLSAAAGAAHGRRAVHVRHRRVPRITVRRGSTIAITRVTAATASTTSPPRGGELNTHRPDYVLLMIGSNDVQWDCTWTPRPTG